MHGLDLAVCRKSSRSTDQGNCVEVAALGTTRAVRDSKNPTGPALRFATAAWIACTTGVRTDEFNLERSANDR
jgi:hypothetical protein